MSEIMEKFEAYYLQKMNSDERENFQARLQSDEKLDKQYLGFTSLMEALEREIAGELRQKMQQWENESSSERKSKVFPLYKILSIAAGILLLIGFISINILYSDSAIHRQNKADFVLSPTRTADNSVINPYFHVYNAYTLGNYTEAIKLAEKIDSKNNYYGVSLVLQAKAYASLQEPQRAQEYYLKALNYFQGQNEQVSKEFTDYNYLLFLFKNKDKVPGYKKQLQYILDHPDHLFYKKAKTFKEELDSFWRNFTIF